jgi:hypothetical protein
LFVWEFCFYLFLIPFFNYFFSFFLSFYIFFSFLGGGGFFLVFFLAFLLFLAISVAVANCSAGFSGYRCVSCELCSCCCWLLPWLLRTVLLPFLAISVGLLGTVLLTVFGYFRGSCEQ